jgi:NADH:ubiquinone oxidoreductase subunit C
MKTVEQQDWRATVAGMKDDGFAFLDSLTAIDRGDHLDVVVHLVNPDTAGLAVLGTRVPSQAAQLDSITSVLPAAGWHERETAEMFGITFVGHPDPRPLLLRSSLGAPPLRKSTVLAARVVQPWPGAADEAQGRTSGSRRRQRPPGVSEDWLHEGDG